MARAAAKWCPPVAVVHSRYNASITDVLRDGAVNAYTQRGGREEHLVLVAAPGSFELPSLCLAAARTGKFAGVLALGCVIKGETSHDRVIADAVANGLVGVTLATGVPACFGVLTVDSVQQAKDRAGGSMGNKGFEAMNALLDTIAAMGALGGTRSDRAPGRAAGMSERPDKASRRGRRS